MKKTLTIALIFLSLLFVSCDNTDTDDTSDDTQTADESPDDADDPTTPSAPTTPATPTTPTVTPDPIEGVRIVIFCNSTRAQDLYFEVSYNGKTRTFNGCGPYVILLTDATITTNVSYKLKIQSAETITAAAGYYVNGYRCVLQEITAKKGDPDNIRVVDQSFSFDFCENYLTFDRGYEYDIDKEIYNSGQVYTIFSF